MENANFKKKCKSKRLTIGVLWLTAAMQAFLTSSLAAHVQTQAEALGDLPGITQSGDSMSFSLSSGEELEFVADVVSARQVGVTVSGRTVPDRTGSIVFYWGPNESVGHYLSPEGKEAILIYREGLWEATWPTSTGFTCDYEAAWYGLADRGRLFSESNGGASSGSESVESARSLPDVEHCHCDDGEVIDLLIAYTPLAKSSPNSSGVSFSSHIQLSVGAVNQAMAASGLSTRVRAVASHEVDYDETWSNNLGDHFDAFWHTSDGMMDDVHEVRDQVQADLLALYVYIPGAGGIAFGTGGPEAGFSANSSTAGISVLAHELGHNLGAGHDAATDLSFGVDPLAQGVSYNHGHRFQVPGGQTYITVMSYFTSGEQLALQYSNHAVNILGVPTGIAPGAAAQPACNATMIKNCSGYVSSYRDDGFADCNKNGVNDREEIREGVAQDKNKDGIPDECERRLFVSAAGPGGDGGAWQESWTDLKDAIWTASFPCSRVAEIWVSEGEYYPDRGREIREMEFFFGRGSVRMFGGFNGTEAKLSDRQLGLYESTLSGDLLKDDLPGFMNRGDNSYNVLHMPWQGRLGSFHTVVDGFTVRSGHADGTSIPRDAGGGMRIDAASPTIRNCRFIDNYARWGGAVNVFACPYPVRIKDTLFEYNYSGYRGGAIQTNGADRLAIDSCVFRGNESEGGGALAMYFSHGSVSRSEFEDNLSSFDGGGIWLANSSFSMSNSDLNRNHAGEKGGGFFSLYGGYSIDSCMFSENSAVLEGGGIWSGDSIDDELLLDACTFRENHAGSGGAVFNWFAGPVIDRGLFLSNSADWRGGAIANLQSEYSVYNSIFSGNSSASEAGAIHSQACANGLVTQCTVMDSAPEAIVELDSRTLFANSIVWESGFSALRLVGNSSPSVEYCSVEGGWVGPGNVSTRPDFVDSLGPDGIPGTGDEDLRLAPGSPAGIDAGSNWRIFARRDFDFLGNQRIQDDPNTIDTGLGGPPVVDMGAIEFN